MCKSANELIKVIIISSHPTDTVIDQRTRRCSSLEPIRPHRHDCFVSGRKSASDLIISVRTHQFEFVYELLHFFGFERHLVQRLVHVRVNVNVHDAMILNMEIAGVGLVLGGGGRTRSRFSPCGLSCCRTHRRRT